MSAFSPENILQGPDGRWYHDGIDVTDRPVWWLCPVGHSWQASLAAREAGADCPRCKAGIGRVRRRHPACRRGRR